MHIANLEGLGDSVDNNEVNTPLTFSHLHELLPRVLLHILPLAAVNELLVEEDVEHVPGDNALLGQTAPGRQR